MSGTADAWTPGRDETPAPPGVAPSTAPSDQLPDVMKLFTATLNDLVANFVDYFLAGLGLFLPVFVVTLGLVLGALVLGFVPMVLGTAFDQPELGSLFGMIAMFVAIFAAVFLATAAVAPLQASLGRAMLARIETGERLTIASAYNRSMVDVFPVFGLTFAQLALTMLGVMMCYLPGLIVGVALTFALPAMIVHRLGPFEAIGRSLKHTMANPLWHLGFFGLGFVILFVGQQVPLIGPVLSLPFWLGYTLRGYIGVYGGSTATAG